MSESINDTNFENKGIVNIVISLPGTTILPKYPIGIGNKTSLE